MEEQIKDENITPNVENNSKAEVKTQDAKINISGLTGKIAELESELSKTKAEAIKIQEDFALAQDELAEANDKMLRAVAEAQNTRRRAEIDIGKAHQFGLEKFVRELISVVDTLEKAVASIANDSDKEGVDMILKMLLSTLEKFAVLQINPVGEIFNPEFHEAVAMVPNDEFAPNSVIEVMNKGYSLNGRVLRPAMVVVSAV